MTTWTLEHAKAIVAAWPEVEVLAHIGVWEKPNSPMSCYCTEDLGNPKLFRLPPKKRIVEWTAQDVKPGMVFRHRDWTDGTFRTFYENGQSGIYFSLTQKPCAWKELSSDWQYSFDAITWFPCSKEVEG